jgi:hypothetical protein
VSIFKSILGVAAPIVGGIFGGPVGAALGGAIGGALTAPKSVAQPAMLQGGGMGSIYGNSGGMMQTMGALPRIGAGLASLGGGAYAVGRAAGVAVGRVYSSAARYCRTNPGWCQSIGGIAAVEALINSGQLPVHKRRRGRGITSREFRGFRRVHKVLSGFCAPKMRIRRKRA